jgi:hypothetical protein
MRVRFPRLADGERSFSLVERSDGVRYSKTPLAAGRRLLPVMSWPLTGPRRAGDVGRSQSPRPPPRDSTADDQDASWTCPYAYVVAVAMGAFNA